MALAFVTGQHWTATNSGGSATSTTISGVSGVTAGNTLAVIIGIDTGISVSGVTDSAGNTYTLSAAATTSDKDYYLAVANSVTAPSSITISHGSLGSGPSSKSLLAAAQETSGGGLAADGALTASSFGATTAMSTGSLTPSANGLALGLLAVGSGTAVFTVGSGWTDLTGTFSQNDLEGRSTSSGTAVSASWSASRSAVGSCGLALLKPNTQTIAASGAATVGTAAAGAATRVRPASGATSSTTAAAATAGVIVPASAALTAATSVAASGTAFNGITAQATATTAVSAGATVVRPASAATSTTTGASATAIRVVSAAASGAVVTVAGATAAGLPAGAVTDAQGASHGIPLAEPRITIYDPTTGNPVTFDLGVVAEGLVWTTDEHGYKAAQWTLRRVDAWHDWPDLKPFSRVKIRDRGITVWEGRLAPVEGGNDGNLNCSAQGDFSSVADDQEYDTASSSDRSPVTVLKEVFGAAAPGITLIDSVLEDHDSFTIDLSEDQWRHQTPSKIGDLLSKMGDANGTVRDVAIWNDSILRYGRRGAGGQRFRIMDDDGVIRKAADPTQLYNRVSVQFRDSDSNIVTVGPFEDSDSQDAYNLIRSTTLQENDLSSAQATAIGKTFLSQHAWLRPRASFTVFRVRNEAGEPVAAAHVRAGDTIIDRDETEYILTDTNYNATTGQATLTPEAAWVTPEFQVKKVVATTATTVANIQSGQSSSTGASLSGWSAGATHAVIHLASGPDPIDATQLQNVSNSSNDVPVSNGTVNTNLNADKLDGSHATDFMPSTGGGTPTFTSITINGITISKSGANLLISTGGINASAPGSTSTVYNLTANGGLTVTSGAALNGGTTTTALAVATTLAPGASASFGGNITVGTINGFTPKAATIIEPDGSVTRLLCAEMERARFGIIVDIGEHDLLPGADPWPLVGPELVRALPRRFVANVQPPYYPQRLVALDAEGQSRGTRYLVWADVRDDIGYQVSQDFGDPNQAPDPASPYAAWDKRGGS